MALPVEDILDLTAAVKRKKMEVDQAVLSKDIAYDQLKLQIASLFVKITNNLVALKSIGEAAAAYQGAGALNREDFENGNFDDELMHWVVKYPTTAAPWSQWNSLIFWHSSSEWWKHNEYWFIFRNLPRLQPGQKIQVIWNGQLTTYEMIERKVVNPKDVGNYYHEFVRDWEYYLTLMGCYPIWSSSQRMMVVAKKVTNE